MSQVAAIVRFDDDSIRWRKLGEFEHFVYTMLGVDAVGEVADFALKFVPDERIFLHRHCALTITTVIQGEHRLYDLAGPLKEVRPFGSYTVSPASNEPHREGGGGTGAIVVYSTRGSRDGVVFEVLDDTGNLVGTLRTGDFAALFETQGGKPAD